MIDADGSNLVPVVAANRVGEERVKSCEENAGQKSSLLFYGFSFITDGCGEIQAAMGREKEGFIAADFDLDRLMEDRLSWGLFRDRRPEMYGKICSAIGTIREALNHCKTKKNAVQ